MNDEPGYYERLLADAEAELIQVQAVIAFARKKLGLAGDAPAPPVSLSQGTSQLTGSTIPSDAFFKMSPTDAIKKYLGIVKQPKSANAITDAMREGSLPSKSEKLYSTVYAALKRGQGEVFSKVKKDWGLAEWYR